MIRALKPFFAFPTPAERAAAGAGWALFILVAAWAIFRVPMGMDEALPYHPLACLVYPYAHLHTFREGCDGRYDLHLFGITIPGAYQYVGFVSSALYAPVFFLFHAAAAQDWFGLAFFLLFAFSLARLLPQPALGLPLILSFFPLLFQFIHDDGPVRFSMLVFPLGAMAFRRMAETKRGGRLFYALALAVLVFLAAEDKIFFLYVLPSFAFFCLAFTGDKTWPVFFARLKKSWFAVCLAAVLIGLGLFVLLFSATVQGHSYFYYLRSLNDFLVYSAAVFARMLAIFLLVWPAYGHRIFDLQNTVSSTAFFFLTLLTAGFFLLCLILGLARARRSRPPREILLALSFIAMPAVFLVLGGAWAGHHLVFLWVPLVVMFADLLATRPAPARASLMLGAILISAISAALLSQQQIDNNTARDRAAVFAYLQDKARAAHAIVNFSSWGGYYIQSLYGPKDQLVTFTSPLTRADAQKLLALGRQTGRQVYDVCVDPFQGTSLEGMPIVYGGKRYDSVCGAAFLENMFDNKVILTDMLPGQRFWHVFAATQAGQGNK